MSFTRNLQNYLKQSHNQISNKCEIPKTSSAQSSFNFESNWSNSINDYSLLDQIGSGSFGQVFRSRQIKNQKECAIKCISKLKSPNIGKILSEVSIHIRLLHRNILQLFTVLEDPKNVYLVMEICYGGSLAQLIGQEVGYRRKTSSNVSNIDPSTRSVLPYDVISIIVRQICDALSYLHRNSIVHRDLNLNNILLVNVWKNPEQNFRSSRFQFYQSMVQIKIADFGLAIDLNSISTPAVPGSKSLDNFKGSNSNNPIGTTICGTPGYISPEIWTQMRTVSYKSDIFSLGSIVFACIAGYTPKGDIDLSNFLPMTADLITGLLNQNPDDRPDIPDILHHIFLAGRISPKRLNPIEKQMKSLRMSIDIRGNVELCFRKSSENNLTISLSNDGEMVHIGSPSLPEGQQIDASKKYNFYELPEQYWKKYLYLVRFVRLVQAKTPKITVYCSWNNTELEQNIDDNQQLSRITRCTLMENGNFEVTFHDENQKYLYASSEEQFPTSAMPQLPSNLHCYKSKLDELYLKVLKIERKFTLISTELNLDLFPASFGSHSKLMESSQKLGNSSEVYRSREISQHRRLSSSPLKSDESEGSFLCSQILRSMQINGIGHATQFSNGSIKVNFNDGSDLCLDNDSQIFFIENGILKKFNKEDILPEIVLDKIATLPQVINHLRESKKKK